MMALANNLKSFREDGGSNSEVGLEGKYIDREKPKRKSKEELKKE